MDDIRSFYDPRKKIEMTVPTKDSLHKLAVAHFDEILSKADALAPVQPNEDETDLQLVLQQNSLALRKAEESAKQLAFFER